MSSQTRRLVVVGPASFRRQPRTLIVAGVLVLVGAVATVQALAWGDFPLTIDDVIGGLMGTAPEHTTTIVREWRLPRAVAALVFGGALGVSGAIFQTLTRNPLASPDIIGLSSGASFGSTMVLMVFGGGHAAVAFGSVAGALLTALLIWAIAYRGGMQGFRLIIVGIAVTAMLGSASTYIVLKARLEQAMQAAFWQAGSLARVTPEGLVVVSVLILLALGALALLSSSLAQMDLGREVAIGQGVRVGAVWVFAVLIGVVLTALPTSVAGPIAFVSLAAPQIARRLAPTGSIPLTLSGLLGAASLAACDVVAQHALHDPVPVGMVTVVFGGAYLLHLLVRENRRANP